MALQLPYNLGPWDAKVTRIIQIFSQPCDVDALIWVLGYFAASPQLAVSFLAPDCLDHTADRVRPGHRRRRRGSINVADFATRLAPPDLSPGWVGYKLLNGAQRVGFYLTVIDAYLDWVVAGTSLAYQWTGCNDPTSGYATLSMENDVPLLLPPARSIINSWKVESQHIFRAGPSGFTTPKGQAVGVGFSITQNLNRHPPLKDCTFTCTVMNLATGYQTPPMPLQDQPDGSRSLTWASPYAELAHETGNWVVIADKSFGVMNVTGTFSGNGTSLDGLSNSACGHSTGGV